MSGIAKSLYSASHHKWPQYLYTWSIAVTGGKYHAVNINIIICVAALYISVVQRYGDYSALPTIAEIENRNYI